MIANPALEKLRSLTTSRPITGTIVHFTGHYRDHKTGKPFRTDIPAIITSVKDNNTVNLRVLYDGDNDVPPGYPEWATNIEYDGSTDPDTSTWHWIPL